MEEKQEKEQCSQMQGAGGQQGLQQLLKQFAEMEETQKAIQKKTEKQLAYSRLSAAALLVFTAAFVAAMCLLVPRAMRTLDAAGELMVQAGTLAAAADKELASVDRLLEHADSFVSNSESSLTETMEKVNAMDLDTLNQAIQDLQAVVEPLANTMRKFG